MKARIEVLLSMWGRWAVKRESGGLGYPSTSPMFRDGPKTDGFGSAPPLGFDDGDMAAVDAAVNRLPTVQREVVMEVYRRSRSFRQAAAILGISPQSVGKFIDQAHAKIELDIENQCEQNHTNSARVHRCAHDTSKPAQA